jgi:hypothetical protein
MAKKANGMTKNEAVRQALAELGPDAKPMQMRPFIKEHFGIDMTTDHISTAKGEILRKQKGKKKSRPKPRAEQPPPGQPKKQPARAAAPNGISLQDIETVQGLVGRVGAGPLKGLIDLLAR